MKKMKTMGRQGDVLLCNKAHSKLRKETKQRLFGNKKDTKWEFQKENRVPLAYGEVSGHAHAFYDDTAVELWYSNDVQETVKHLDVKKDAIVSHEEHEAIQVPVGDTAVLIQNEYIMGDIRRIAD